MNYLEIFQLIFVLIVFAVGLTGFMIAATKDDK